MRGTVPSALTRRGHQPLASRPESWPIKNFPASRNWHPSTSVWSTSSLPIPIASPSVNGPRTAVRDDPLLGRALPGTIELIDPWYHVDQVTAISVVSR
ncbi:hypothetical protein BJX76DRAFT_315177 [Aspergillus varians]